jgi:hypothetical protein
MSITPGCQVTSTAVQEGGRVHQVVLLSLAGGCLAAPVLACRDALVAEGADVSTVVAGSDADIDAAVARLDGPARPDGLCWPSSESHRLVVAASAVGQVRAVVRRMIRRYAPPPSKRPSDLAADRTMPDLPPIGVLPLYGVPLFGLPSSPSPAEVAKWALHGTPARLDLLRTDGGSATLDGAFIGGEAPWSARIEVDSTILAEPREPIAACVIGNGSGYAVVDGLPFVPAADPADGTVDVAVAVPVRRFPWQRVRVEVRRARGRAVAVTPSAEVPLRDDDVTGTLARKRSWWIERGAWAVLRP